jgi:hypothetical protein
VIDSFSTGHLYLPYVVFDVRPLGCDVDANNSPGRSGYRAYPAQASSERDSASEMLQYDMSISSAIAPLLDSERRMKPCDDILRQD